MIRLAAPDIDDSDVAAVAEVLRSGHLVQGRQVALFESDIGRTVGARHAVAVSNCTAALQLALLALETGPGDEVVVPAYSWPATANVVVRTGATPVFVDIEEESWGMAPAALEAVLKQRRQVKAILPVHAFGQMADLTSLMVVAQSNDVVMIEDAACALGANANGRHAGSYGIMGCFSFHPRKAITTGEGGVVVTSDAAIANRIRTLRNHGQNDQEALRFTDAGLNMRMTEMQAALGRTQLRKLERLLRSRREQASRYGDLLSGSGVVTPVERDPGTHAFQAYVTLLPAEGPDRELVITRMRAAGVEVTIGTHHIPLLPFYRKTMGFTEGSFPVTDDISRRSLALPLHTRLAPDDQKVVVDALLAALD